MDMRLRWIHFVLAPLLLSPLVARAQAPDERIEIVEARVSRVEQATSSLESDVDVLQRKTTELTEAIDGASLAGVLFLVGVFCALWAQNTRRNPWLWFFLGLFFHWITLLVLLSKNAENQRAARAR
jgi:hypothetical protein